jgi:hypothetical protein
MLAVECYGKTKYLTYDHAKKVVKRRYLRLSYRKDSTMIYRCKQCCSWHVGGHKD